MDRNEQADHDLIALMGVELVGDTMEIVNPAALKAFFLATKQKLIIQAAVVSQNAKN